MKKIFTLTALMLICILQSYSQNEFYINGAQVKIEPGALVHVQGDFHLDNASTNNGRLDNDGTVELRGNFVINSANVEQTSATNNSTGVVRFKNYGYTTETSHQHSNQRIEFIGTDATGDRAFYNVEIENDNRTDAASTDDNYVDIKGGDVEIKNTLTFNNDSRLVTDDAGFVSNDGSTYDNEVYISNTSTSAIGFGIGVSDVSIAEHNANAGRVVRYIEGKLAREVTGTASYYFPLGLQPGFQGIDGMEAFSLNITAATTQKMSAYLNIAEQELLPYNRNIFCDVGAHPGVGVNQPFSTCAGGPDGIEDRVRLTTKQSHEWVVTNAGVNYNYDIQVYPGVGLSATAAHEMGDCGGNLYYLKYLVRDGKIDGGNTPLVYPGAYPHHAGYRVCPPINSIEGNKLNGQSEFSTFRIHGAIRGSSILPVEVASFEAYPVNNEFVQIAWITETEINNDYFEVERSLDNIDWEYLETVDGNGNSNDQHRYYYDDHTAEHGMVYYYRLKQVDFDGTHEYIGPDDAQLKLGDLGFSISEFIPSPALNSSTIQVTSVISMNLRFLFYNNLGQIIEEGTIEIPAGSINQAIEFKELDRLAASTYFLTLTNGEQTFYRTLVKNN